VPVSCCTVSSRSCIRSRVSASSAANGSSSSRTLGRLASARARPARWAIPPDTCRGWWLPNSCNPTTSSQCCTAADPFERAVPGGSPNATLAARERHGSRRGSWKTIAQRGSIPSTALPSISIRPSVGRSRPATSRSSVDLPLPEDPSNATTSPGLIAMSTSWSTVCVPNVRSTRRSDTHAGAGLVDVTRAA
jgi:hypothetical protein